ncbi:MULTISPECIES: GNAT family N-acetyltransferase [unclassified Dyella]|jgi:RimJ/RimL family protein N-acetyltransferase|uniref:GNAT family N-acetyltransferase n=1 Tax=unclassified Dyella TaxID=2634549 RepID=UPI003F91B007
MRLTTARLRIDALHEGDAAALFGYRADPEVSRYQGWCPQTLADADSFIRTQMALDKPPQCRWFQRAIRSSDDGVLLGDVGFCLSDEQAEIGITIAPFAQGQGYAGETLQALFHALFGSLAVHRIYASVDPRNTPSMALLASVGMRQEAHFRESLLFRGEWVDDVVFALLAREWRDRGVNDAGFAASR